VSESQSELFEEMPATINLSGELPTFRQDEKVIDIPYSFWKDGRIRADLSAYGAGEIVSRNKANLQERVLRALRDSFGATVEAVYREFACVGRQAPARPRISNKRPAQPKLTTPVQYINPFSEKWNFAKCPDWLFARREPTPTEKRVYSKLLYPAPPISKRFDRTSGIIFGLNQGELAKALGVRRETVNAAVKALKFRGLIEITGGSGAAQVVRFLLHGWMPSTCALNAQVEGCKPVRQSIKACAESEQQPVIKTRSACATIKQVSEDIEKRRNLREERERPSPSSFASRAEPGR
jgi:hypothetical protein